MGILNQNWFHPKTLILGYDTEGNRGSAKASFCFKLEGSNLEINEDTQATVTFETERIHGGLHSAMGPKKKRAIIKANGKVLDDFWLVDKMPNGEDYGFQNVGPIPINRSFLSRGVLMITVEIEDEMAWDIDRVIINVKSVLKSMSGIGYMVVGAIISVMISLVPVIILQIMGK